MGSCIPPPGNSNAGDNLIKIEKFPYYMIIFSDTIPPLILVEYPGNILSDRSGSLSL